MNTGETWSIICFSIVAALVLVQFVTIINFICIVTRSKRNRDRKLTDEFFDLDDRILEANRILETIIKKFVVPAPNPLDIVEQRSQSIKIEKTVSASMKSSKVKLISTSPKSHEQEMKALKIKSKENVPAHSLDESGTMFEEATGGNMTSDESAECYVKFDQEPKSHEGGEYTTLGTVMSGSGREVKQLGVPVGEHGDNNDVTSDMIFSEKRTLNKWQKSKSNTKANIWQQQKIH